MTSPLAPAIQVAIEQLRAEIIAPDWQLSPQRISRLRDAFATLSPFFTSRSQALALLKMASSVVDHIEAQGNQTKAMDFLKEALAHIVNLYEEDSLDPEAEKEIVQRAYKRFRRLEISLATGLPQPAGQRQNTAPLLATLERLSQEAAQLPHLLAQSDDFSAEEHRRATFLLGRISAAINIIWAQLPPAPPK